MALAYFRMLIYELLNKDTYIVPEEDPMIVLDSKSAMCMSKNGKYTKHIKNTLQGEFIFKEWRKMQDSQNRLV